MNSKHLFLMIGMGVTVTGCASRQNPSVAVTPALHANSADVQPPEPKGLEGTWRMVSITRASGESASETRGTIAFVGGKMIMKSPTGETETYSYRVDALAEPKTIELTEEQNTNAPSKFAIYELEGDRLRIAFGGDATHPKAFSADGRPVFLLQRE